EKRSRPIVSGIIPAGRGCLKAGAGRYHNAFALVISVLVDRDLGENTTRRELRLDLHLHTAQLLSHRVLEGVVLDILVELHHRPTVGGEGGLVEAPDLIDGGAA